MKISQRLIVFLTYYNTRNKFYFNTDIDLWLKSTSLGGRLAGRVLEELELKPTQPPTFVGLGLGLSLAINR